MFRAIFKTLENGGSSCPFNKFEISFQRDQNNLALHPRQALPPRTDRASLFENARPTDQLVLHGVDLRPQVHDDALFRQNLLTQLLNFVLKHKPEQVKAQG